VEWPITPLVGRISSSLFQRVSADPPRMEAAPSGVGISALSTKMEPELGHQLVGHQVIAFIRLDMETIHQLMHASSRCLQPSSLNLRHEQKDDQLS